MDFDFERIARSPFTVGAVGALITAVKFTPGASWGERTFNVLAGSAAAGFITPALVEWLNIKSAAYASGAKFKHTAFNTYTATAGVELTFDFSVSRLSGNPAMAVFGSYMRATLIKR